MLQNRGQKGFYLQDLILKLLLIATKSLCTMKKALYPSCFSYRGSKLVKWKSDLYVYLSSKCWFRPSFLILISKNAPHQEMSQRSGLVWSGLVWSGLVWSGLVWSGLVWSGLVWSGLVWSGLVWSGLVWSGLVWSGTIQYNTIQCFNPIQVGIFWLNTSWGAKEPPLCFSLICYPITTKLSVMVLWDKISQKHLKF